MVKRLLFQWRHAINKIIRLRILICNIDYDLSAPVGFKLKKTGPENNPALISIASVFPQNDHVSFQLHPTWPIPLCF